MQELKTLLWYIRKKSLSVLNSVSMKFQIKIRKDVYTGLKDLKLTNR